MWRAARDGLPGLAVGGVGLLVLRQLEGEVAEDLSDDRAHLHLCTISGRVRYVRLVWAGRSDSRAKFLPMQSRGVWVKGEKRVECGLRAA